MVECKMDEYWIARIQFWPGNGPHLYVVYIYYVWQNGDIDFIVCGSGEDDPIRSTQCVQFKLLEKIEVEKYK